VGVYLEVRKFERKGLSQVYSEGVFLIIQRFVCLEQRKEELVTLYNTGALICINSYLTNAQIIMS